MTRRRASHVLAADASANPSLATRIRAFEAEFLDIARKLTSRDRCVLHCMLFLMRGKDEWLDFYDADVVAEARDKVNARPALRACAEAHQ